VFDIWDPLASRARGFVTLNITEVQPTDNPQSPAQPCDLPTLALAAPEERPLSSYFSEPVRPDPIQASSGDPNQATTPPEVVRRGTVEAPNQAAEGVPRAATAPVDAQGFAGAFPGRRDVTAPETLTDAREAAGVSNAEGDAADEDALVEHLFEVVVERYNPPTGTPRGPRPCASAFYVKYLVPGTSPVQPFVFRL
jgi:hypothetical protein